MGRAERARERETDRQTDRHWFVVPLIYAFIGWFLYVPWLGIESATVVNWDNALTKWATWPWPYIRPFLTMALSYYRILCSYKKGSGVSGLLYSERNKLSYSMKSRISFSWNTNQWNEPLDKWIYMLLSICICLYTCVPEESWQDALHSTCWMELFGFSVGTYITQNPKGLQKNLFFFWKL